MEDNEWLYLYNDVHGLAKKEREEKDRLIAAFRKLALTQAKLIETLKENKDG